MLYRGVEQLVARQAHNLEVACSSPASATIKSQSVVRQPFAALFFIHCDNNETQKKSLRRITAAKGQIMMINYNLK